MGGSHVADFPSPQTIAELNLHLVYLQRDVSKLVAAMENMATKADIEELARKFEGYATQDDLRAFRVEAETRFQALEGGTVKGTLKTWAEWARAISAIAAFGAAAAYFLVGLLNRLGA